ncbi:MAG: Glu-tRNA(Gln) amidotransferase subunit GatE [Candidatus ainarchaeum sp.]|nr:Glu-tRNA(Gln) amidotransferase subunit GatE [Candidatus ainarchaeum sp.]
MQNYEQLGLKVGLEVHQQLDTKKLFIRTPGKLEEETNFSIQRRLRPVASELGQYDSTVLDAFNRDEFFFYEGNKKNISLVELDEEPPQPLEEEALKTAIEIALLCKSKIVNEGIIMRKTIIDGSNTSAFQRTMLLSIGGQIKINNEKNIGIETIILEEDACRPIKKEKKEIHYNLDRLGIPLVELATSPDIKNPEEAVITAKKIGEIFRLTGKTKRGKGTIRQDVNISIKDGNRCEIKGCQDLEMIKTLIEKEIERQLDLVELKKELNQKIKNKKDLFSEIKDISKIFKTTDCKFIKGKTVFGIKLKGMNGFLGKKVGLKRFGSELSAYAKSNGVTGIIHKDELPNYGITEEEKKNISKELLCGEEDNFIFIVDKKKSKNAFESIKKRILIAFEQVPKETRGAEEDGSSTYQRPLSGEARMYPETDLLEEEITEKKLNEIKKDLPKNMKEREQYYTKIGLSTNQVEEMKINNYARFFEKLVKKGANPRVSATLLLQTMNELKRDNFEIEKINEEKIEELLLLEKKGKISKNNLKSILIEIIKGKTIKKILEQKINISGEEIKKIISKIISKNQKLIKEKKFGAIGPLMGDLMKEEKLREIDGKFLSDLLKKEIQKNKI